MNRPSTKDETDFLPAVAIVVLNWNAWPDTIECLETVLRTTYSNFHIVLCDNGSTDGSVERIVDWVRGNLCAWSPAAAMQHMSQPPAPRPGWHIHDPNADRPWSKLTIIENGENLGFAAGNNAGLRFALEQGADFAWLLNCDTTTTPNTLANLVTRATEEPDIGLCGSLLCYYDAPDTIQEAGGCAYYPLIGMARRIAADMKLAQLHDWRRYEATMDYVSAASTLVSRKFLTDVGLMSEDYFLYCEEIDWATRGAERFKLALAEDSIVYHKKGISTGSKSFGVERSPASAFFLWRARRRFTQKFHKVGLPGLFIFGLFTCALATLRGQRDLARAGLDGLFDRPRQS